MEEGKETNAMGERVGNTENDVNVKFTAVTKANILHTLIKYLRLPGNL